MTSLHALEEPDTAAAAAHPLPGFREATDGRGLDGPGAYWPSVPGGRKEGEIGWYRDKREPDGGNGGGCM